MKPKLKPPGTKRLKLKYDEPLSTFGFNFNSRRYIWEARRRIDRCLRRVLFERYKVGRCRLILSNQR